MDVKKILKSTFAVVLFGLLIVSFAMFGPSGVTDVFTPVASDVVLTVDGRQVSGAEYKAEFERLRQQFQEQQQRQTGQSQPISLEQMLAAGQDGRLLTDLEHQEAIAAVINRLGVRTSPKVIAEEYRQVPAFFDRVTGKFDPKLFNQVLAANNLEPKKFEQGIGEEIARNQVLNSLGGNIKAPLTYSAFFALYGAEARDASFVFFDAARLGPPPVPTEAQLQQILNENRAQAMKPEFRQVTVVRFSTKAILPTVTADPAQVQKVVDFRKDAEAKPETRTIVQIPARSQAEAQALAARLAKGEDPNAVAKSAGASVINYADKPKTALPDKKVADAAFQLAANQASAVQGDLGWAAVKIAGITPGEAPNLDALRQQAIQEVKQRAAEQKVSEQSDAFEEARSKGADILTAAKQAGAEVATLPPITAQGIDTAGEPVPGLSAPLVQTAFGLAQGQESDIVQEQKGEYFLVRLDKITPPALPTVAEIRPQLVKFFQDRDRATKLKAKSDELVARAKKGESLEAIAASLGGKVEHVMGVSRKAGQQQAQTYGAPMISAVLGGKKGEVQVAGAPRPGFFLVRIDEVKAGDPKDLARDAVQARDQLAEMLGGEIAESFARSASTLVKVKSYPDRARQAIGAPPLESADAKGKAKK